MWIFWLVVVFSWLSFSSCFTTEGVIYGEEIDGGIIAKAVTKEFAECCSLCDAQSKCL